ncbi:restriction endonuclease [Sorangium sp. So ce1014]|uniref:restriction endonuclease n=1 Tax=Sorangium sp. So ce1014 TaxID=3133326 RepID=UPI003F6489E1
MLAAYLLSHIVGCFPVRKSETSDFENDLVIRNLSRHVSPALDILGRYFLVECKNWKNTVGTHEIAYFANRVRYGRVRFGVLFAREGISGDAEDGGGENGRFMIHRAYHQDGIVVAVVTASDLQRICDGTESTLAMLLRKHDEVRFGAWSRAVGPRDQLLGDTD